MNHFKNLNKLTKESDKKKYLIKNGLAMYEVICSFKDREQIIVDIIVNNESEKNLIFKVFDALDNEEIDSLVKLSYMRLYTNKFGGLPKFIQKNNGKYFENELKKFKEIYFQK